MSEVDLLRAAIALLFVLGLIAIMTWLARRMQLPGFVTSGSGRRLKLVETLVLDPRHKVVLLQADEAEHLLVLGPGAPLTLAQRAPVRPAEPGETARTP